MRRVQLTSVPDEVADAHAAAVAMGHALHECSLLANQQSLIRNSACLRVSLLQHLFTAVLPLPLPLDDPERERRCFWREEGVRHETQAQLLRLVSLLAQHHVAATSSLQLTRELDGARILTLGCMVAIADASLRLRVAGGERPSALCEHYAGDAAGPLRPYGFEVKQFEAESEALKLTEAELMATRGRLLDYFASVDRATAVAPRAQRLFCWEQPAEGATKGEQRFGAAELTLVAQVCAQLGFPCDDGDPIAATKLLTGDDPSLVDLFPELVAFRDTVFLFKLFMSPSRDALPRRKLWLPEQAKLSWGLAAGAAGEKGALEVRGFADGDHPKGRVLQVHTAPKEGFSQRLLKALNLTAMHAKEGGDTRAPPSAADPGSLLRAPDEKGAPTTEDDMLGLPSESLVAMQLADDDAAARAQQKKDARRMSELLAASGAGVGGAALLTLRDAELLLQYLTAPYLRIPLLLNFFTDQTRVSALASPRIQEVLEAALFEPGAYAADEDPARTHRDGSGGLAPLPEKVPPEKKEERRELLATPLGLLFNELVHAPAVILTALRQMLTVALDMDTGSSAGASARVIFFVVRLAVRVEGFVLYLQRNREYQRAEKREREELEQKEAERRERRERRKAKEAAAAADGRRGSEFSRGHTVDRGLGLNTRERAASGRARAPSTDRRAAAAVDGGGGMLTSDDGAGAPRRGGPTVSFSDGRQPSPGGSRRPSGDSDTAAPMAGFASGAATPRGSFSGIDEGTATKVNAMGAASASRRGSGDDGQPHAAFCRAATEGTMAPPPPMPMTPAAVATPAAAAAGEFSDGGPTPASRWSTVRTRTKAILGIGATPRDGKDGERTTISDSDADGAGDARLFRRSREASVDTSLQYVTSDVPSDADGRSRTASVDVQPGSKAYHAALDIRREAATATSLKVSVGGATPMAPPTARSKTFDGAAPTAVEARPPKRSSTAGSTSNEVGPTPSKRRSQTDRDMLGTRSRHGSVADDGRRHASVDAQGRRLVTDGRGRHGSVEEGSSTRAPAKPKRSGAGGKARVRGLELSAAAEKALESERQQMDEIRCEVRALLDRRCFPLLERWFGRAMKAKDLRGACTVTAHLALLSKSVDLEVGTSHLASLLSSFVFLTHNFVCDAEQSGDLPAVKRESSEAGKANALGVPQTQVFDLYQQKRHQIVEMLRKQDSASHSMGTGLGGPYQKRLNDVMEAVTRVTAFTGGRKWRPGDIKARMWAYLDAKAHPRSLGRFMVHAEQEVDQDVQPDEAYAASAVVAQYRKWLTRTTTPSTDQIEVNVELGEYIASAHKQMQPLPAELVAAAPHWEGGADFVAVFGAAADAGAFQSAEVAATAMRRHLKLVGRKCDLQRWLVDADAAPKRNLNARTYDGTMGLSEGSWLRQVLDPVRLAHNFAEWRLYLPWRFSEDDGAVMLQAEVGAAPPTAACTAGPPPPRRPPPPPRAPTPRRQRRRRS